MRRTKAFTSRLRLLFRRARIEHEMDAELRFHLDQQIAENLAAGMGIAEARAAAMRSVGNITRVKEDCRESLGLRLIDELRQDVRYGAKSLFKNPGFTIVAVLSLAVGIGANCAIFSFADALLLRPLPVARPGEVFTVGSVNSLESLRATSLVSSYRDYVDIRDRAKSFEGLAAFTYDTAAIRGRCESAHRS